MKKRACELKILMNGILIGALRKNKDGGLIYRYDKSWLAKPGARPLSLSLPLMDQEYTGDLVYNYFDNLLPDNEQMRARIQARFRAPTNHPFDLLAKIGKDCVGAIQIVENDAVVFRKQIKCLPVKENQLGDILQNYRQYPLGMNDEIEDFRISLAGAQEKAAFLRYRKQWNIPLADTPTTHIFKLPIGMISHQQIDLRDSCENEWLCSEIAAAFGIEVAKCEIKKFADVKVLVVERFDRKLSNDKKWLMRLPQEDMCQALGFSANLKYQADGGPGIRDILKLLATSEDPLKDQENFYRAQILFWLLAAIDGHAKNFSIFIEPEGKFRLTPLYDIMSAYPLLATKQLQTQKIKMAMALQGKNNHYHWHTIQRRHFIEGAKSSNFSSDKAEAILDEMLSQVDNVIDHVTTKIPANFPKQIAKSIFDGVKLMKRKLEQKN